MTWSEDALHRWIAGRVRLDQSLLLGPGDDAALVAAGERLAITNDQVVEGVHFESGVEPRRIGHKLAGRALSDLAAMGACPRWAILAVAAHASLEDGWLIEAYLGVEGHLERHGARIVGGDLARTPGGLVASLTLFGGIEGDGARRDGARIGDDVYVTGRFGGSILERHLDVTPRVQEGQRLVREHGVCCMMDVSDGLSLDLHRLCLASGVGAVIEAERIPLHADAHVLAERSHRPPLEHALGDGEDYELLFTWSGEHMPADWARWEGAVTCIGRIVPAERGIRLRASGQEHNLPARGYRHG